MDEGPWSRGAVGQLGHGTAGACASGPRGRVGMGPCGRGAVRAITGERSLAQDGATAFSDAGSWGQGQGAGAGREDLGIKDTLVFFDFHVVC
jgi:hypothetical protein